MGMTVQSLFHIDIKSDDISFFYTTTGWVMFNLLVGMMLAETSIVLYDGNPAYPEPDVLWKMAADTRATGFGASPTYVQVISQLGINPGEKYDLSQMRWIACSGSPAAPEVFEWFYRNVKKDLWVSSQSGGIEIVGGFVCASPTLPVYAGEIQCRGLGMAVEAWNENGEPVLDEVGELVCTKPFPSMPLYFLNDEGNQRYQETYFNDFPGVWRHGDFIKINQRGGAYIYGRSDATLNRYGVRIGTSELYRTVENLPKVVDSLVVCIELPDGKFFMPMFLQLAQGIELNEDLQKKIISELRSNCSPRHVPDKFYAIDEVPYTLTGKKLEVPVRKLLLGWPLDKAASRDSMRNPESINFFLNYVATTEDFRVPTMTS
jgi:acetoacetyl-CoA synthetase